MNRFFRVTTFSRALAVLTAFACVAVALTPGVTPARGDGAIALAVMAPQNTGKVSSSILAQVGQAMYAGIVASGRYDVRGGGPLHQTQEQALGSSLPDALAAAGRAGATEALITDVVKAGDGKLVYSMALYRVNPVTFGRSQVFAQSFPPSDAHVFAAQFANDLASLEAPRTSTGTIYSVLNGILSDTGSGQGFHLGQRFSVVRGGKKVAEAQIAQIAEVSATLEILNPTAGYTAQVGDRLISDEPGSAIPVGGMASSHNNNGALTVIGLIVGVGAALLALSHNGAAATLNCPPPTPSGSGCTTSPTPSGGSFTVTLSNSPSGLSPTFKFLFSKPVLNAASLTGDMGRLFVQQQIPPGPLNPATFLSGMGGATGVFDGTNTLLTVTVPGSLTTGSVYFITFTNVVSAVDGSTLTLTPFRYPQSGTLSSLQHPTTKSVIPKAPANWGVGSGGNGGAKPPQPHQPGGNQPHSVSSH